MPKTDQTPAVLRPYLRHGVHFSTATDLPEVVGDCPFCGKESKFFVNSKTGLYSCKVCATGSQKGGGNHVTFIRELWKMANESTTDYDDLAADRKLLRPETLIRWEAVVSPLTGEWMIPGYSVDGRLSQLYRYRRVGERMALLSTPELRHGLGGVNLYDGSKSTIYLLEGVWDAIALWEVMSITKVDEDGSLVSSGEASSLLKDACVLSIPGANVWQDEWCRLMAGKRVVLLGQSDHPKRICGKCRKTSSVLNESCGYCGGEFVGKVIESASLTGMKRAAQSLAAAAERPESVHWLAWGSEGYDPERKSGWDVRDHLTSQEDRRAALAELILKIEPIPDSWVGGRSIESRKSGDVTIQPQECDTWTKCRSSWVEALKWTPNLDHGMVCVLACAASTTTARNVQQLWIRLVSPASSGKTTLVEALNVAREYVVSKDTFTGISSGFQIDREGKEDMSMIPLIRGKTLVIKDGDTLMSRPNLQDICAQLRALYDRSFRVQYKNKMSRNHEEVDTTVILCGTSSIRKLDSSELGERWVDVVLMEGIDEELESDIQDRIIAGMFDDVEDDQPDTQAAMLRAKQLTGGYVNHLRRVCPVEWPLVKVPQPAREAVKRYALFVAYMRARPSVRQVETAEREMAPRLTEQFGRLVKSVAIVLNKRVVDDEVLYHARKVAVDTGRGVTQEIAKFLHERGAEGAANSEIESTVKQTATEIRKLLKFLEHIRMVERFEWIDPTPGVRQVVRKRWRLTERVERIYSEVVESASY